MTNRFIAVAAFGCALAVACSRGIPQPVDFDAAKETCRVCRMSGSDGRTAAQLLSPDEEPMFFDDLGCLSRYLNEHKDLRADTVVYVVDHRTREWIRANEAQYARAPGLATPMNSHLVAHASIDSRDADAAAKAGVAVTLAEVFPAGLPQGGVR